MRPSLPVPVTSATGSPAVCSACAAAGIGSCVDIDELAGFCEFGAGSAVIIVGIGVAAGAAEALAPASTRPITMPGVTVTPSPASISDNTPSAGATTSSATLSVSMSTNTSSFLTASPAFFDQLPIEPSDTDSPITGTRISSIRPPEVT